MFIQLTVIDTFEDNEIMSQANFWALPESIMLNDEWSFSSFLMELMEWTDNDYDFRGIFLWFQFPIFYYIF